MSGGQQPTEPPPSYDSATGPSTSTPAATQQQPPQQAQQHAQQPSEGNQQQERDIENEDRPLPPGWVPQFNAQYDRFFFVDTFAKPPKSIWTHPLDDQDWLSTVPHGMDPLAYVDKLWQDMPEPTPEPAARPLPGGGAHAGMPGVRQGNVHGMQGHYPGTSAMQGGQMQMGQGMSLAQKLQVGMPVTLSELTEHFLSKMGTPEEYESKNPPSKASKMFHKKETARQRQRRHAEHKAQDVADALSYRAPGYSPYGQRYAYPGYGRGYNRAYPGLGMSGAFLGLGTGALLGAAMF